MKECIQSINEGMHSKDGPSPVTRNRNQFRCQYMFRWPVTVLRVCSSVVQGITARYRRVTVRYGRVTGVLRARYIVLRASYLQRVTASCTVLPRMTARYSMSQRVTVV